MKAANERQVLDKAAFFRKIGYEPHEKQKLFHDSTARFRLANCGRRFGKLVRLETPLLTPSGWQTMASINIGDYVYGPTGAPNRVVDKSEIAYNEVCYEVVFDDGAVITAHDLHQWAVETYTMRKSRGNGRWGVPDYKIMTTEQLRERVGKVKYPDSIMLTQPVQMPQQKQELDAYIYGLWLGDGTTLSGALTAEHTDCAIYAPYFEAAGLSLRLRNEVKYSYYSPELHQHLRKLGVLGNKGRIPDEYRFGSIEQRLALLQGLMDTDGTLSNEQIQFDNSNRTLVELVAWLVNSLGGKGRFAEHEPYYMKDGERVYGKTSYRFGFNIALPVFRLQRKLDKQMRLRQGPQTVRRYIKIVRRVESVPMQCIQVEDQDGLYLAGVELVVTHNSHMAGRDLEPRLFVPNRTYWIVGPSYDLGEKEFRVIWMDLIVGLRLGQERAIKKAYQKRSGAMYIEFPWNTRLEVRSADHPELLVGEALDHVILSEAAKHKEETWERYLRPALADRRGTADFPTTPEGHNWLYHLWMYGQDPSFPDYESWRFPSWENKVVYPLGENDPEIVLLKRTMAPEAFEQEIGADFSSFSGKIYPEWDVARHVTNVPFRPDLPNYVAIDWGYTNPSAWIEFQVTPDDRVRVWREYYEPYRTLSEHIHFMKNREQPQGYHLDGAFADSADPAATEAVSRDLVGCWALPDAKVNWREGIDLVRSFMDERETGREMDEFGTPEMVPAFLVDFSCKNVINEFNNYRSANPIKGKNVPEVGQKAKDHAMDAIRYGLMHVFKLGAANSHLSDVYSNTAASYTDPPVPAQSASVQTGTGSPFAPFASSELVQAPSESGYFSMNASF